MAKLPYDDSMAMSQLIAAGDVGSALDLYRGTYPFTGNKVFQEPDRELIEAVLASQPQSLDWLHTAELRELQTVAVMHIVTGEHVGKLLRPGQQWNYSMTLEVAVNAVISNYNWTRNRKQLHRFGLVRVWQYLRSCDPGTCVTCDDAGRYLYSDEDFPGSPIPGCTNSKNGCRCLAVNLDPAEGESLIQQGKLLRYRKSG